MNADRLTARTEKGLAYLVNVKPVAGKVKTAANRTWRYADA